MKTYKLISIIVLALCLAVSAKDVTKVGTTAARFLNIDVDPRGIGMGSAYVAVVDNATATYWNPAALGLLDHNQAYFGHTQWIMDVTSNFVTLATPIPQIGSVAVSAKFLSMGDMERTTITQPDGTGEFFDAFSYAVGLSYARNLTDRVSVGFTGKYINERIYHSSSSGLALDIGTLYRTGFRGLNIGMSITNYGTKMQMEGRDLLVQHDISDPIAGNNPNINANLATDSYDIPLLFRFGLSMNVLENSTNHDLFMAVDALHPNDDKESLNVGLEYVFNRLFFLRAGYKSLFLDDSEEGLSLGAGFAFSIPNLGPLMVDYAYQNTEWLDSFQHFAIKVNF